VRWGLLVVVAACGRIDFDPHGDAGQPDAPSITGCADTSVAVGKFQACALRSDRTVACWGANTWGQLGDGTTTDHFTPVETVLPAAATQLESGAGFNCALLGDGRVACWGHNGFFQIGDGTTGPALNPEIVALPAMATSIAVGPRSACAILVSGDLYCWGYNGDSELGDGTQTNVPMPKKVGAGVVRVALGHTSRCDIHGDATLWCTGENSFGQLATGDTTAVTKIVQAMIAPPVADVVVGGRFACAIGGDRSLTCWARPMSGRYRARRSRITRLR
jgi:alpha-tubulin suppressor-like RCC1 family protein